MRSPVIQFREKTGFGIDLQRVNLIERKERMLLTEVQRSHNVMPAYACAHTVQWTG